MSTLPATLDAASVSHGQGGAHGLDVEREGRGYSSTAPVLVSNP